MMTSLRPFALALLLGTALPAIAVAAPPVAAAQETLDGLIAAPRLDVAAVGRLYDRALTAGTVAALHARVDAMAAAATPPGRRARILLVEAALYWREGDRTDATAAADAAIAVAPGVEAYTMRGELAEILDAAAAADFYRKARALATDPAERARLDLRIAMIDALPHPETLLAFARTRPATERGDLAVVLALLGKPGAALELVGTSGGTGAAGMADALRVAEWAAAGDAAATRDAAWRAYTLATDTRDRRYALALLVEGYRTAKDLEGARAFLAARPQTPEMAAALVDVLLELGRIPEATALVRGSRDPELRGRLIGILDLAGDTDATRAEYRRLIAAAPRTLDNYAGLAAAYLGQGDTDKAREVFRDFFAANRGRTDLLTAAGRQMIAMGLGDEALALMRTDGSAAAGAVTRLFLFRSYLDQGKEADARAELAALAAGHPSAALLGEIADGYGLLHEPGKALDVLHRLEAAAPLDYDRQVQAADLAARAGATDEALRRWTAVWREATLPARRGYAEKQLTALARQAGRIDQLARESETRLATGKAMPGEIDLLLSLRLAQDDRAGALAAVQRYAAKPAGGAGEVDSLRQLAQIYARLKDYQALQTTLRRLAVVDPANRDDYLRQLTLTLVRYGDAEGPAKAKQIDTLMGEFRDAAPEFRGAVYAMAGMGGAALDQYRAALAADPGDGDALARYADALKKQGGGSQSATLLQFQAETATTQDGVAAALDGMLDLVDPGSRRDAIGTARLAALQWVERRALERIAAAGADSRLTGILVDVAEMLGDMGLEVRTYEASLPAAGGQRPYLLRQLLMLTAPEGIGGEGKTLDEPQRRLRYARRLLALRQPYPPEFYGEIATAMLKQGDRAGAERAFAMMDDGGALVNVDEVRGRAYAAAGLTDAALAAMGLALARDHDNLDLLVDTSILREQNGRSTLAFEWYWRGLARVIARQAEGARNDADQQFDSGRFVPTLTEGALLNWPADPAGRAGALAALRRMFDAAVASVDRAAAGTLLDHARLDSIVDLGRRIRAAGVGEGVVAAWDATLDPLFAGDFLYRRETGYFRDLQGEAAADGLPGWPDRGAAALFVQARDSGNAGLALTLAIGAGDMAMVRAALEDQFRADLAWRAAAAKKQTIGGMPPDVGQLLGDAVDRLSPDQIRAVVAPVVAGMANGETALFDLYRARPDSYHRLADALGRQPIADARLLDLLNTGANVPIGWSGALGAYWGGDWTPGAFTTEQQLDLYDRLTARIENGNPASPLATAVLRALLTHPLSSAQSARLAAILQRDVAFVRDPNARSVVQVLPHLLMPDALPANRGLLMAAVAQASHTYSDAAELAPFLDTWFAGKQAEAMHHLDALEAGLTAESRLEKPIEAFRNRQLAEIRKRRVAAVMDTARPPSEAVDAFYKDVVAGGSDSLTPRQRIDYARRLIALDPERAAYRAVLIDGYRQAGDIDMVVDTLRPYGDAHPGDARVAAALAIGYRLLGRRAEADAVAQRGGAKLDDAGWIAARLAADRSDPNAAFAGVMDGMYARYGTDFPDDAVVREVAQLRGRSGDAPGALETLIDTLTAAQLAAPATVPGVLRGWWRTGLGDAPARDAAMRVLARRIGAGDDPVLAAIFARPDVVAELSRYLTALSAEDRHAAQSLYDLVALGEIANGRSAGRLAELSAQLRSGAIDADDLQHLETLADIAGTPLDAASVAALVARQSRSPAMAVGERVRLAAVLARSGQLAATTDLLAAALDQTAYPFTPLDRNGSAGTIVASLARWPDRRAAEQAYRALVERAGKITASDHDNTLELPPL